MMARRFRRRWFWRIALNRALCPLSRFRRAFVRQWRRTALRVEFLAQLSRRFGIVRNRFRIMAIEKLNKDEAGRAEWNEFIRRSAQGSIFATTEYLDALNANYELYVVRKGNEIDVGVPLVRGIGWLLTNPPFVCKYLGVVTRASITEKPSIAASQLYEKVDALGDLLRRCRSFDYLFHPDFDNWLPLYWMGFAQQTLYTYRILCKQRTTWWSDADSRLRRSVRRGEKGRVSIHRVQDVRGTDAALCYELCMEPFRQRKARASIPHATFERLARRLCPDGSMGLWLAREADGAAVAAAAVLYDWRSSYLLLNGTSQEATTGANSLLIKTVIDDSHAKNIDFDFEGSMLRPVENFYRLFGGERTPYYRIWNPTLINAAKRLVIRWGRKFRKYER
jgi:hypothetical protein